MLKYIRYTLAALCFAASVGCLGLWGWGTGQRDVEYQLRYDLTSHSASIGVSKFHVAAWITQRSRSVPARQGLYIKTVEVPPEIPALIQEDVRKQGVFGLTKQLGFYFPLWYPALIFALAGVGILRIGRFTIRSALMVTAIVALLLGMVVVL